MCGLFGGVGTDLNKNDVDVVKELGFLSALRGMDSTGVAFVYRKHGKQYRNVISYDTARSIDNSVDFLYNKNFDGLIKEHRSTLCIMGHTRAATIGSVKRDNAHPFRHGSIIGAHNGHVPAFWEEKKLDKTDSERLIREIADKGLVEALQLAGEAAHWALSYLDTGRNELRLLRNDKRPLAVVRTQDGKKMFWASDGMFLELVKARYSDKINFADTEYVTKHEMLTWSFGNSRFTNKYLDLEWPKFMGWPRSESRVWEKDKKEDKEYPDNSGSPFKDQEEVELKKAGIVPLISQLPLLPEPKKVEHINIYNKELNVTETSIECANRVFDNVPWNGYPKVVILNEHRKILHYIDFTGRFIGNEMFRTRTEDGCMLSGRLPTMEDRILWISPDVFVFEKFKDDPLVIDEIKSKHAKPRLGQPIYIASKLMINANYHKQEDAQTTLRLAAEQLHDHTRMMFDPAFVEDANWEDTVECH